MYDSYPIYVNTMQDVYVDDLALSLLHGWSFSIPWWDYLLWVLVLSFVIRAAMCLVKALEMWLRGKSGQFDHALHAPPRPKFWREFWQSMKGYGSSDSLSNDYWLPSILGTLELLVLPVVMATNNWTFVGAWVGFKALAQARHWIENRSAFNRFVFGTAVLLIFSYVLAWKTIDVRQSYPQQLVMTLDV